MLLVGFFFILVPSAEGLEQCDIFGEMRRRGAVDGDGLSIFGAANGVPVVLALEEMLDAAVAVGVPAHGQEARRVALGVMVGADWAFKLLHPY